MSVQVISRDGQPEYAVVPWAQYQALLAAAGQPLNDAQPSADAAPVTAASAPRRPSLTELPQLRADKGLDPQGLARSVGISPSYLDLIERGERQPDAAILRSLAWHLGIEGWSLPA